MQESTGELFKVFDEGRNKIALENFKKPFNVLTKKEKIKVDDDLVPLSKKEYNKLKPLTSPQRMEWSKNKQKRARRKRRGK